VGTLAYKNKKNQQNLHPNQQLIKKDIITLNRGNRRQYSNI
jgi:hypothetical protein